MEGREGSSHKPTSFLCMNPNIVPLRFEPNNLREGNPNELLMAMGPKTVCVSLVDGAAFGLIESLFAGAGVISGSKPHTYSADCLLQPVRCERLQEIIDRINTEGLHGMAFKGCCKNNCGLLIRWYPVDDVEAGEARHSDVKEDDVWPEVLDEIDRSARACCGVDDLHAVELTQRQGEPAERQGFVIDQKSTQMVHAVLVNGIWISAR